jgi:predicted component of type VI protein secretion system
MAMALMMSIMGAFGLVFIGLSSLGTSTQSFTQSQTTTRITVRVLAADLRSADPLLLTPTSFTGDSHGISTTGAQGSNGTDVIAMYEANDTYSPCRTQSAPTNSSLPSNFESQPVAANVIWAYDPGPGSNAATLTRYSYCPLNTPAWTAGFRMKNVSDLSGTMFTESQDSSSPLNQATTPSSTTLLNQAAPACASSLTVLATVKPTHSTVGFTISVTVALPNQAGVAASACVGP